MIEIHNIDDFSEFSTAIDTANANCNNTYVLYLTPNIYSVIPEPGENRGLTISGQVIIVGNSLNFPVINPSVPDSQKVIFQPTGNTGIFYIKSNNCGTQGSLSLYNVVLRRGRNIINGSGGAITNESVLNVYNSYFYDNQALYWGGAIASAGTTTIINSVLENNQSTSGLSNTGGGAIFDMYSASLSLECTSFISNSSANVGGALQFAQSVTGTTTLVHNADVQRSNNFINNTAAAGYANIYNESSTIDASYQHWNPTPSSGSVFGANYSAPLTLPVPPNCAIPSVPISSTPTPTPTTGGYACPCSLWTTSNTPAVSDSGNNTAVEVGVKFQSAVTGSISGIRFYKDANNTGTHIGHLWTSGGTLLASVTFTGESASGWQTATFSSPVAISANTLYVISYHTPSGRFSYTSNYFASSWTNGPLTAPDSASSGGNGVYTLGGSGSFPTGSASSPNFWVDVIFSPTGSPTLTPTRTPTPTLTPTAAVNSFKINIISDGSLAWTTGETTAITDAVNYIGIAFDYLATTVNTQQTAFNLVMIENSGTEVLFIRTQQTSSTITVSNYQYLYGNRAGQTATFSYTNASVGYCVTIQEGIVPNNILRPAAVICNSTLIDQYNGPTFTGKASPSTIAHELGHLFDYRTSPNGGQTGGISGPVANNILQDCDLGVVMGVFNSNWTRGRRGWGTGPAQYLNASGTPVPLVTNFQQNSKNDPVETAADSFLNWVTRIDLSNGVPAIDSCSLTPRPPYSQWNGAGFLNLQWDNASSSFIANSNGAVGTPDPSLPGDRRYWDMDVRIRQIFLSKGW